MIRPRRIVTAVFALVLLQAATHPVPAGVIKYVVGEKTEYYSPQMDEHFRPSSVYSAGSKYSSTLVAPDGTSTQIPQNRQLGKEVTLAVSWNSRGDVVGDSYISANENVGFLFRNGELTYLTEQVPMTSQGANAINERGQIVGGNWPLQGTPYFYENGTYVPLQLLPGATSGRGTDINESGIVVGDNFYGTSGSSKGVLYDGTTPIDLTSVTQGLDGMVVRSAIAIMDDNRIVAELFEQNDPNRIGAYWLEPVILELGDSQAKWDAAKAAITGEGIPMPPEEDPDPTPADGSTGGSNTGGTTVVDNGSDGGFWNTPMDVVNPDHVAVPGSNTTATPNVTIPEPVSIVMWGLSASAGLIVRERRRNRVRQGSGSIE